MRVWKVQHYAGGVIPYLLAKCLKWLEKVENPRNAKEGGGPKNSTSMRVYLVVHNFFENLNQPTQSYPYKAINTYELSQWLLEQERKVSRVSLVKPLRTPYRVIQGFLGGVA